MLASATAAASTSTTDAAAAGVTHAAAAAAARDGGTAAAAAGVADVAAAATRVADAAAAAAAAGAIPVASEMPAEEKEAREFILYYTTGKGSKDAALKELFCVCFIMCSILESHRNATRHCYAPLFVACDKCVPQACMYVPMCTAHGQGGGLRSMLLSAIVCMQLLL